MNHTQAIITSYDGVGIDPVDWHGARLVSIQLAPSELIQLELLFMNWSL